MDSMEEHDGDPRRSKEAAAENPDISAIQKKRARRVSFAEMTSVHFFDRDEEYNETSLVENEKDSEDSAVQPGFAELLGGGEENGGCSDDDEAMEMRRSFLRPVGSPSPGGSTLGSASSNDDDFFGPVSANFIRPVRFSDSGASDDNRDVTMDSATFSMHFRSLARSDSGVDLKASTEGHLSFEEKTPTNADSGNSMAITLNKKPSESSIPFTETSGNHNSNDMSLVGGTFNRYDYEKLSPRLHAILEESKKNLLSVSVADDIICSIPTLRNESEILPSIHHGDNLVNLSGPVRTEIGWTNSYNVLHGDKPASEANAPCGTFSSGNSVQHFSSNTLDDSAPERENYKTSRSPSQSGKLMIHSSEDESAMQLMPSTSPAKWQQIVLPSMSPSKDLAAATPTTQQYFPLQISRSVEHKEIQSSIQKSISKLDSLEKSALSSAFAAKVDSSTIRSLDFPKSPNFSSLSAEWHHTSTINEDPFTDDKIAGVPLSKEKRPTSNIKHQMAEPLTHIGAENYLVGNFGQIASRRSSNGLSANIFSAEQSKYRRVAASPTRITWSGNNLKQSLFAPKRSDEDALMTETEALFPEVASQDGGNAILARKLVSCPDRVLEKRLSASSGLQYGLSEDLLPHKQLEQISDFQKGQDSTLRKNFLVNSLTAFGNKDTVTRGMTRELTSPFAKVSCQLNKETDYQGGEEMIGTIENLNTSPKKSLSTNLNVGNGTNKDTSRLEKNLPRGELIVASHGSISMSSSSHLNGTRLHKNQVGSPTASPSRKGHDNNQSPGIPLPTTTQMSKGLESISSNKRSVELFLRDSQRPEMAILQRSSKIQKGVSSDLQAPLHPSEDRTMALHERKKWTDTYSEFSENMKDLICGVPGELSSKMMDVLEDMLVHQQKSKKYEMLCLGIMPQGKIVLDDLQLENMAEINSLLHQVVFRRARLLLKHAKRERLSKRLKLLGSRIKESETLRANTATALHSLKISRSSAQRDGANDLPLSVNFRKGEVTFQEKLAAMSQESEALGTKILSLTRSLQSYCKMKSESSCDKTIALVNEHLQKRVSCRFMRMEMQMWSVHSVESSNGHHNVILNYLDFIVESIKIIVGPISSVATSFKLIETNIIKNFPNMDACVAFAFVFSSESSCKYVGTKTLARETQVTSSILGTLLDVIKEVQLAQMEFHNLMQSSFCSSSVDRLELLLSFFDFNTGRKVSLTLDMSCLKRGIYPLEVLPLQITSTIGSEKCSSSAPIFDEIRAAVKSDETTRHMRILHLCRCVSQSLRASTA